MALQPCKGFVAPGFCPCSPMGHAVMSRSKAACVCLCWDSSGHGSRVGRCGGRARLVCAPGLVGHCHQGQGTCVKVVPWKREALWGPWDAGAPYTMRQAAPRAPGVHVPPVVDGRTALFLVSGHPSTRSRACKLQSRSSAGPPAAASSGLQSASRHAMLDWVVEDYHWDAGELAAARKAPQPEGKPSVRCQARSSSPARP